MSTPRFHTSVVSAIRESQFKADADQIKSLAQKKTVAGKVDEGLGDTYLGALVANTADRYYTTSDGQEEALNHVSKWMYAAVKDGVVTPEIADLESAENRAEVNRRATFARTAKSVLRSWLKAGNHIGDLDPAEVRKNVLQAETEKAKAESATENTPAHKVAARLASLLTALKAVEDDGERATLKAQAIAAIEAI